LGGNRASGAEPKDPARNADDDEPDELIAFYEQYRDTAMELTSAEYVQHMEPGASEDGANDISRWIVAQGKDYYEGVLDDPAKTPFRIDRRAGAASMFAEISKVFYDRYEEEILDFTGN
jgi:hypothetical protein